MLGMINRWIPTKKMLAALPFPGARLLDQGFNDHVLNKALGDDDWRSSWCRRSP